VNCRQMFGAALAIAKTGIIWPARPWDYLRMLDVAWRWGASLATASAVAAVRVPEQAAVIDDRGSLTWKEVDGAADAVARALVSRGLGPESMVGLMCRNSRWFLIGALAVSKLGADLVLLNTEFGTEQLDQVLSREGATAAIFDDEFVPVVEATGFEGVSVGHSELEELAAGKGGAPLQPPGRTGRIVIMTSGTTGLPKGAQRGSIMPPLNVVLGAFSVLPLRAREPVVVASPLFHALGLGFMGFALGLQGSLIVQSRFDPEATLAAVSEQRATVLVVVPVMLQRIMALSERTMAGYDTSSLRVIVCSGSSLSPRLATAVMDRFGEVLYDFYGSTEAGLATMATPADLRDAPGTVGRAPMGTTVAILDERGRPLPAGRTGRIFVGGGMAFDGYTGGGGKEMVGELLSTGDTGHLDDQGRLFVEGRDDEMIVSGGENVFPAEVEALLRDHESVDDAAVVGVDDEAMGQRLAAFVVVRTGASLSVEDIKGLVRSRLARFKVPRDVTFVEQIPRNATGKVRKPQLGGRPAAEPELGAGWPAG